MNGDHPPGQGRVFVASPRSRCREVVTEPNQTEVTSEATRGPAAQSSQPQPQVQPVPPDLSVCLQVMLPLAVSGTVGWLHFTYLPLFPNRNSFALSGL